MEELKAERTRILERIGESSKEWLDAIAVKEKEAAVQREILNSDQAQGDHSENAVYQSAKDALNLINIEIKNLNDKVAMYQDFNNTNTKYEHTGTIKIGSTVRLYLHQDNRRFTILLVPPSLGSAKLGAVSVSCPVGSTLLGKKVSDVISVVTTSGTMIYTIEEVY